MTATSRKQTAAIVIGGALVGALLGVAIRTATAATTISPGQSLASALTSMHPGDTLLLTGDTAHPYTGDVKVTMPACSQAQPCTVAAAPGAHPLIVGLFWITGATWTTFDGIRVTWPQGADASSHMWKMTGGSHWTLRNVEASQARSYANLLISGGADSWLIDSSCFHDNLGTHGSNQDHNIYVNAATNGRITNSTLFNATGGRNIKEGPASGSGGPKNVEIDHDTLYNAGQGISLSGGTSGSSIHDNVIAKTTTGDLIDPNSLTGSGNTAQNNRGWSSHTGKFIGDSSVKDLGGNVLVAPLFSALACPTSPTSSGLPSSSVTVPPTVAPTPVITPSPVFTPTPIASVCGG